ncbi:MAG: HesB/IscA family protein [Thiobacillaceae bacterium]
MVTVTPNAAEQILEYVARASDLDGMSLRLAARLDATGSIEYAMGFDTQRDDDVQVTSSGVSLLINESNVQLLNGVTLDFDHVNGEPSFVFINPNHFQPSTGGGCQSGGCGSGGCGSGGHGGNGRCS